MQSNAPVKVFRQGSVELALLSAIVFLATAVLSVHAIVWLVRPFDGRAEHTVAFPALPTLVAASAVGLGLAWGAGERPSWLRVGTTSFLSVLLGSGVLWGWLGRWGGTASLVSLVIAAAVAAAWRMRIKDRDRLPSPLQGRYTGLWLTAAAAFALPALVTPAFFFFPAATSPLGFAVDALYEPDRWMLVASGFVVCGSSRGTGPSRWRVVSLVVVLAGWASALWTLERIRNSL